MFEQRPVAREERARRLNEFNAARASRVPDPHRDDQRDRRGHGDVPMALLAFTVGVAVGQVAVVLLVLPVLATWRDLVRDPPT